MAAFDESSAPDTTLNEGYAQVWDASSIQPVDADGLPIHYFQRWNTTGTNATFQRTAMFADLTVWWYWGIFLAVFLIGLLLARVLDCHHRHIKPKVSFKREARPSCALLCSAALRNAFLWESDSLERFVEVSKTLALFFVLLSSTSITQMTCDTPSVLVQEHGWDLTTDNIPRVSGFRFSRDRWIRLGYTSVPALHALNVLVSVQTSTFYFNVIIIMELLSYLLFIVNWKHVLKGGSDKLVRHRYFPITGALLSATMCLLWGAYETQQTMHVLLRDEPSEVITCTVPYLNIIARSFALLHLVVCVLFMGQIRCQRRQAHEQTPTSPSSKPETDHFVLAVNIEPKASEGLECHVQNPMRTTP